LYLNPIVKRESIDLLPLFLKQAVWFSHNTLQLMYSELTESVFTGFEIKKLYCLAYA